MKQNIKGNREKYKKQEREFEGIIDDDGEKEVVDLDGPEPAEQSEVI